MVLRYYWGHSVGHTYAYGGVNADVTEVPLPEVEIEDQESDLNEAGPSRQGEDDEDLHSIGEDDMVYFESSSGDSDASDVNDISEEDVDDEVCHAMSQSHTADLKL